MRRACLVGLLPEERTAVWRELEIATVLMEASAGRDVPILPAHVDIRGRASSCTAVAEERLAPDAKPRPVLTGLSPRFLDVVARGTHEETKLKSVNLNCLDTYRRSSEYKP
jgi:hypothetical protein